MYMKCIYNVFISKINVKYTYYIKYIHKTMKQFLIYMYIYIIYVHASRRVHILIYICVYICVLKTYMYIICTSSKHIYICTYDMYVIKIYNIYVRPENMYICSLHICICIYFYMYFVYTYI